MAKGISIHIAAPERGPGCSCALADRLRGPLGDAEVMAGIACREGYEVTPPLLEGEAKSTAVLARLKDAAGRLHAGDSLLLTYSGHGCQLRDQGGGDSDGGFDETWCLADRQLRDDELAECWTCFNPGVFIVVVSDSCNSGTVILTAQSAPDRPMWPGEVEEARVRGRFANAHYLQGLSLPSELQELVAGRKALRQDIKASVLLLYACEDGRTALDGYPNSLFTRVLHASWLAGSPTYTDLITKVRRHVRDENSRQLPGWFPAGAFDRAFLERRPFSI